jgi:inner membrane protein
MTAPTHLVFSAVTYFYLSAILRLPLSLTDALLTGFASLLPDLDTSSSGLGRWLRFTSSPLEKRFGHRTITHSFFGVFLFALLSLPLLFKSTTTYAMWIIGFAGHGCFLDLFNKAGCRVFYPSSVWGVFPGKEENRITVGSTGEHILFGGLVVVGLLLYPLASIGLNRTLHYLMSDISGAIKDYYTYGPDHEVTAELTGVFRKINTSISGTFPVLDALSEQSLLIEIKGNLYVIGSSADAHIVPRSIRLHKGKAITHYTQTLSLDGHRLKALSSLSQGRHRLFGHLQTLSQFEEIHQSVICFNPIKGQSSKLILDHATYQDIEALGLEDVVVLSSNVIVETTLPAGELYRPIHLSQAGRAIFALVVDIANKENVKVTPAQQLQAGTLIAAHSGKLRDITLMESELETLQQLRQKQSFEFAIRYQENQQGIEALDSQIASMDRKLLAYKGTPGFEKEIRQLKGSIAKLQAKKKSLFTKKSELTSQDEAGRLRHQQDLAQKLSRKETLEAEAFVRAESAVEVVNLVFTQNTCTLYLRGLPK